MNSTITENNKHTKPNEIKIEMNSTITKNKNTKPINKFINEKTNC
jgi:hypothetical protein